MKLNEETLRVIAFAVVIFCSGCATVGLIVMADGRNHLYSASIFMSLMLAAMTVAVHFAMGQDYSGEGRARLAEVRARFGNRYRFSRLLLGQLTVHSLSGVPLESDAFEMAKMLWVEGTLFRKKLIQSSIPFLDQSGKRCFFVTRGLTQKGSGCLLTVKNVGSSFFPKLVGSTAVELV